MPAPQLIWPLARGVLETNYNSTIGRVTQGLSTPSWQLHPNVLSPSLKQVRLHWDCYKLVYSSFGYPLWAIILHSHCPGFLQVSKYRPCISNKKWLSIWKTLCYLFSSLDSILSPALQGFSNEVWGRALSGCFSSLPLCFSPSVTHQKIEKGRDCRVSLQLNLSQLKAVYCPFND